MTGHGRGRHSREGALAEVELRSVNRRQAEFIIRLPQGFDALESRLRDLLARIVSRGRVEASVQWSDANPAQRRVNRDAARHYARELRELADELRLERGVTLSDLLRCPGVLETSGAETDAEAAWGAIEAAALQAAAGLNATREREGAALAADLAGRVALLRSATARARELAPAAAARQRDQLVERLRQAGWQGASPDDDRLARELVLYADRLDVAEELTRLESHFSQFDDCLRSAEPVGRRLDFLAQEMGREINTLGNKANDARLSAEVVLLKTDLERFREQAQNIE